VKIRKRRPRTKRWHPSQVIPILDPQIQIRKRKWSQIENLAGGVLELLPRYAFYVPVRAGLTSCNLRHA